MAQRYARLLSHERGAEVRWNYKGSQQGHYVRGCPLPADDGYKRVCQINTEDCSGHAHHYIQYEVDSDLDYSMEFGGQVYHWGGFACDWCAEEIYQHVASHKLWRYRETQAGDVTVSRVGKSEWFDIMPDWSNTGWVFHDYSDVTVPKWDKLMPHSQLWEDYWRGQLDSDTLDMFQTPFEQYKHLNGTPFVVLEAVFEPGEEFDREVLPMFKIDVAGEEILAWPEEIFAHEHTACLGCMRDGHNWYRKEGSRP